MAGEITCKVGGLEELERMLTQLAPKEARLALRRASRQAAVLWQEEMIASAPKDTGFTSEHIRIKARTGAGDETSGKIVVSVGPDPQAKRAVESVRGKPLKRPYKYAYVAALFAEFGRRHQGARPFIAPAFERKKQDVLDLLAAALKQAIDKFRK